MSVLTEDYRLRLKEEFFKDISNVVVSKLENIRDKHDGLVPHLKTALNGELYVCMLEALKSVLETVETGRQSAQDTAEMEFVPSALELSALLDLPEAVDQPKKKRPRSDIKLEVRSSPSLKRLRAKPISCKVPCAAYHIKGKFGSCSRGGKKQPEGSELFFCQYHRTLSFEVEQYLMDHGIERILDATRRVIEEHAADENGGGVEDDDIQYRRDNTYESVDLNRDSNVRLDRSTLSQTGEGVQNDSIFERMSDKDGLTKLDQTGENSPSTPLASSLDLNVSASGGCAPALLP
eukprot:GILK01006140.1.p1 GENE.GILK01006140.1~~GILK01006140.1.p1  ORF type:complete len:292 (-),score=42.36 GILK01006140.1:280-1155(-)